MLLLRPIRVWGDVLAWEVGGWRFPTYPHAFGCNYCCDLGVIVWMFRICYLQFRVSTILHLMFWNTWNGVALKCRCGLPKNEWFWLRLQCDPSGCALATIYQYKLCSLICSRSMVVSLASRLCCRHWLCLWICVPFSWYPLEQLGFRVLGWMLSCKFSVAIFFLSLTCPSS
jgi:hypothetical protein